MSDRYDAVVVGAGVIGTSIAWRACQRGLSVALVDPAPGTGATHTAAGMLAPVTELHYGEQRLLRLNLESARRYAGFVAELEAVTGDDVGYRTTGTVVAAWDAADLAALHDLHDFQCELGLGASLLTGRELRELEPNLAPGLPGGVYVAGDHQVDPRRLHAALRSAAVAAGVAELRTGVRKLRTQRERTTGVALDDGSVLDAGEVVLAAGAWSTQLDGLPPGAVPGIRPVKGQTLQLREPPGVPAVAGHVVRGTVRGAPVYLLPRDGSIVVGASSEEVGFDLRPRAGAVYELLRDAQALLPAIGELELVEVSTGLRPATEDNAPVLGPTDVDGLVLAVGHYRNGVLLAPVTADLVAALLAGQLEEKDAELLAAFGAQRFAATAGATR